MTLLIGMLNRRQAVLLADRRLSVNGRLTDDESNKAITLICQNARLAFAFTGLARVGTFETRLWLMETLADAAAEHSDARFILERLTQVASNTFAKLRITDLSAKRLTILCVGYLYDGDDRRGMLAQISNFERGDCRGAALAEPLFTLDVRQEKRPAEPNLGLVIALGANNALNDRDFTSLRDLVAGDKPPEAIVGKAVDALRKAADSPAAHNVIGKQCSSIILPSNPKEAGVTEYHSMTRSHTIHGVSQIEARGEEFGIILVDRQETELHANGRPVPLIGPKLGRNEPCWCGSGKKYKRCHG